MSKGANPKPGMIEIRTVVPSLMAWAISPNCGRLEYRYVYDWGGAYENWRWSEWKAVPVIAECEA